MIGQKLSHPFVFCQLSVKRSQSCHAKVAIFRQRFGVWPKRMAHHKLIQICARLKT
jgi:hypothetical protein